MSRLSTIEALVVINFIWRFWCAIPLRSIGGIIPHWYIVGLLLALSWCLILLLLLLCTLLLLLVTVGTCLTLIALLRLSLLRVGMKARVALGLLSLKLPLFVLQLAALVLNH